MDDKKRGKPDIDALTQKKDQETKLREAFDRAVTAAGRLGLHDVAFNVTMSHTEGNLGITVGRTISFEVTLAEMMADWLDAKQAAEADGRAPPLSIERSIERDEPEEL